MKISFASRQRPPLDSTHVFLINGLYELPIGYGRNSFAAPPPK
jgi:hypothetical protein